MNPTPTASGPKATPTPPRPTHVNDGDLQQPMELHDFMSELGVVMQLPPKTTVRMRAVPEPAGRSKTRQSMFLPALAVILMIGTVALKLSGPRLPSELPEILMGEWATPHPSYASRRLAFSVSGIGITDSVGKPARWYSVQSVATRSLGDSTSWDITYLDEGDPVRFMVHHIPRPVPHLLLSNPPGVSWERMTRR